MCYTSQNRCCAMHQYHFEKRCRQLSVPCTSKNHHETVFSFYNGQQTFIESENSMNYWVRCPLFDKSKTIKHSYYSKILSKKLLSLHSLSFTLRVFHLCTVSQRHIQLSFVSADRLLTGRQLRVFPPFTLATLSMHRIDIWFLKLFSLQY